MPAPRVLVLRAPGTNCDDETAYAFEAAGAAAAERVHVNRLMQNPTLAERYQVLCIPGGFSYGDDIAAGRILAGQLQHYLADVVRSFAEEDRLVLGICNGMQVLMRLGVLTEGISESTPATLTWNDHGRFEDRWVHLATRSPQCVFLRNVDRMYLPIAHAEGKFVTASDEVRQRLDAAGRLALRYTTEDPQGESDLAEPLPFPENPNGAEANVAGVCDATGRIFGLMPHPERHIDPTHHPRWTRRRDQPRWGDGYAIFRNAIEYFG